MCEASFQTSVAAIKRIIPPALAAGLLLAACSSPTTLVAGSLIGGGRGVAAYSAEVRFEQNGQVVASARTSPGNQAFEVRLPPGSYEVVIPIFPAGCPKRNVTVQGSQMRLDILCNAAS